MRCFRPVTFTPKGQVGTLTTPCGRCMACRINKTEEWSVRCEYEASVHDKNCFVTLTYSDEFLPKDRKEAVSNIQNFIKRVRKHYAGNQASELKYYLCFELGPTTFRPHYHIAFFGVDFEPENWEAFKRKHYSSPTLDNLWPFGFNEVGLLNKTRMRYVSGYIQKKWLGSSSFKYKELGLIPPFQLSSKNLGTELLQKYSGRFTEQFLCDEGKKHVSRYFQKKLGLNEIMADELHSLNQARYLDRKQEEREQYSELSDIEYSQMLISRRLQKEIDVNASMSIFKGRDKI